MAEWAASGRTGLVDLATERAAVYVAKTPVGLPDDVLAELCAVIDETARTLGIADWPDPRTLLAFD
jgi:hypothetical protein